MNEEFEHPRLAAIYDQLDPDRSDLEPYLALAHDLHAMSVVDLACGTGTLAIMLAERGYTVLGVDPAAASLEVARAKPGADRVRWTLGDAAAIEVQGVDLVTMTGNALMSVTDDLAPTVHAVASALRPGGHFVFETRRPDAQAWVQWADDHTRRHVTLPDGTTVTSATDSVTVHWPFVDIAGTTVFGDGTRIAGKIRLRYRELTEIEDALTAAGCTLVDVRDAPDRPRLEWVIIARRDQATHTT